MRSVDAIINGLNGITPKEAFNKFDELSQAEFDLLVDEYEKNPDNRFGDSLLVALSYATAPWQPDPMYAGQYAYACGYRD